MKRTRLPLFAAALIASCAHLMAPIATAESMPAGKSEADQWLSELNYGGEQVCTKVWKNLIEVARLHDSLDMGSKFREFENMGTLRMKEVLLQNYRSDLIASVLFFSSNCLEKLHQFSGAGFSGKKHIEKTKADVCRQASEQESLYDEMKAQGSTTSVLSKEHLLQRPTCGLLTSGLNAGFNGAFQQRNYALAMKLIAGELDAKGANATISREAKTRKETRSSKIDDMIMSPNIIRGESDVSDTPRPSPRRTRSVARDEEEEAQVDRNLFKSLCQQNPRDRWCLEYNR